MHRLVIVVLLVGAASPQVLIDPARIPAGLLNPPAIHGGSLQCDIQPIKPSLNFGLQFQAGYVIRIPMKRYFGTGHGWGLVLTITPEGGQPAYMADRIALPPVPRTNYIAEIGGGYLLGEGRYTVKEVLLDDSDRSCRKDWQVEARLPLGERKVEVTLPPNTACDFEMHGCPSSTRHDDTAPLRLTVLLNAPPPVLRRPGSGNARTVDTAGYAGLFDGATARRAGPVGGV